MSNWFHRILAALGIITAIVPQVTPLLPSHAAAVVTSAVGVAMTLAASVDKITGKPQP